MLMDFKEIFSLGQICYKECLIKILYEYSIFQ